MPIDRPDNRSFGYRLARLLHHVALSLSLDTVRRVESNRRGIISISSENFKNGVEYLVIELYLQTGSMSRRNSNDKRRGRGETCYARIIYPREDREGRDLVRRERYVIRGVVG